MAFTTSSNGGMEENQGPTFFKIIKTDFNTEDLRIPPKFWKHLLNELSDSAALKLKDSPNSSWTVEVSQTEGEIYFKNGWRNFIRDNSLGDFEFLVFSYDRDMQFSIQIFDRTQCKRVNFSDVRRTDREGGYSGFDQNVYTHIARNNLNWSLLIFHLRMEAAGRSRQSNILKEVKEEEEDYCPGKEEAATLPNFEGPVFTRIMGEALYYVLVPKDFTVKYLPRGFYTIMLKTSEGGGGREWEVGVVPDIVARKKKDVTGTVRLTSGWAAFRRDNQINSGDTCTFELVESKKMVVHIDRK